MLRPDPSTPEGAAIRALHDTITGIEESAGELPGADVVPVVEGWLGQFDFTEPPEPSAPDAAPEQAPTALVELGVRYVLHVAGRSYPTPIARDAAIRDELGIAPTRYFLLLNAIIDQADALRLAPVLVNRLRRLRETKRTAREAGQAGDEPADAAGQ
ncbi:DUF3263 domain-containing protein (plasmid) [Streptomyces sp. SDT5-1]|uniref:DUF3263 domain-containing protein n=1 Tax=Streptomyces sp. SDT5-1 TaxID=3406418 RepID=UPI003FD5C94B